MAPRRRRCEQWYFRPEPGGVLGSPADETLSAPCDARPEEIDVAIGLERINQRTTLDLRTVRASWAGLRTFAPDRLPVIGPDPEIRTFVWFAGQGGYGIQMATGRGAARCRTGPGLISSCGCPAAAAALSPEQVQPSAWE